MMMLLLIIRIAVVLIHFFLTYGADILLPAAESTHSTAEKAVLSQIPEPYLIVNVTDVILLTTDLNFDSLGCPLTSRSSKIFLKVYVSVKNTGPVDYNNPLSIGLLNCGKDNSVLKFFNVSFPGGPYFSHAKCISDKLYTCTNMGISSGATYSTAFFVNIKASAFSSNQLSTIPLLVSVSSHITSNSIQSLPYYVQSVPTVVAPAVINSSTLVGVWVGNFFSTDVLDSSQLGYLSFSVASSLRAVLQLNNGALRTGDARLFIFGDVIFAYFTYSGFYQGFLVRQESNNPNRLVGNLFSLQQGLDFGVNSMYLSKVIANQPSTVVASTSAAIASSTLVGVWVGNFYSTDVLDSSQLGYLSFSVASSLRAVLQLNNGALRTGDARLFIFGDVIFAYFTYSGFYQGFLVRQESNNPNRLVGNFFALQQGLDFTVTTMFLDRISSGNN